MEGEGGASDCLWVSVRSTVACTRSGQTSGFFKEPEFPIFMCKFLLFNGRIISIRNKTYPQALFGLLQRVVFPSLYKGKINNQNS